MTHENTLRLNRFSRSSLMLFVNYQMTTCWNLFKVFPNPRSVKKKSLKAWTCTILQELSLRILCESQPLSSPLSHTFIKSILAEHNEVCDFIVWFGQFLEAVIHCPVTYLINWQWVLSRWLYLRKHLSAWEWLAVLLHARCAWFGLNLCPETTQVNSVFKSSLII